MYMYIVHEMPTLNYKVILVAVLILAKIFFLFMCTDPQNTIRNGGQKSMNRISRRGTVRIKNRGVTRSIHQAYCLLRLDTKESGGPIHDTSDTGIGT